MTSAAAFRLQGVALGLLALCAMSFAGCGRDPAKEPGVVAVVAGSPIRLADVQARHDLGEVGLPEADNPTVARLRAEYGKVLADLIVARLVRQELARERKSVTEAELDAAEKQVRADYPGDAFERMLLEERIDLARWREVLGDRLALEKFARETLRQNARVEVSEAAAYYKEHIDDFTTPARMRLARVQGGDAEAVKAALLAYRKSGNRLESLDGLAGITVREAVLPDKSLPHGWREALKGLKDHEATGILQGGGDSFFCILLKRLPAAVTDPAKAYSRVEATLAGRKIEKAFAAWLAEILETTRITVNKELLAGMPPEKEPELAEGGPDEAAMAREEAGVRSDIAAKAKAALPRMESEPEPGQPAPAQATPEEKTPPDAPSRAATDQASPSPDSEAIPQTPPDEPPPPAVAEETPSDPTPSAPAPAAPEAPEVPAETGRAKAGQDGAPAVSLQPTEQPMEPALALQGDVPAVSPPQSTEQPVAPAPAAQPAAQPPAGGGEITFTAVKASWIRYAADGGQEERVYLKPGKPYPISYREKLVVRLGSPSEVRYSHGGTEQTVAVGNKESRSLEFP